MFYHYILRILFFSFLLSSSVVFSQQKKVNDLENRKKKALKEISNINGLLNESKKNTETLTTRIQLVANQIEARKKVLNLLEEELRLVEKEQKSIESNIITLEKNLNLKKKQYSQMISSLSREAVSKNKFMFLLSGNSLAETYHRFAFLKDYSEKIKDQTNELNAQSHMIKLKQDSLRQVHLEKQKVFGQKEVEQRLLKAEEEKYKNEVETAQSKTKELTRILAQRKRQLESLDRQIDKMLSEELKKQQRLIVKEKEVSSSKSPSSSSASAVSISEEANIKLSGSFESNKGKLPIPIIGKYSLTGKYGVQKASKLVSTKNNGLIFQVQPYSKIRVVFDGEISSIVAIPGFGKCILVRHGSYFTFYGNVGDIKVKQGDKVSSGDVLGIINSDSSTNMAELHFQVWKERANLNPELWLKF